MLKIIIVQAHNFIMFICLVSMFFISFFLAMDNTFFIVNEVILFLLPISIVNV